MSDELEEHHWVFRGELADIPTARQLRELFEQLPRTIGMLPFGPLQVVVTNPEWQAIQMIAESHIAAHGHRKLGRVEVFSCKRFDVGLAKAEIESHLPGKWREEQLVRALTPDAQG